MYESPRYSPISPRPMLGCADSMQSIVCQVSGNSRVFLTGGEGSLYGNDLVFPVGSEPTNAKGDLVTPR